MPNLSILILYYFYMKTFKIFCVILGIIIIVILIDALYNWVKYGKAPNWVKYIVLLLLILAASWALAYEIAHPELSLSLIIK